MYLRTRKFFNRPDELAIGVGHVVGAQPIWGRRKMRIMLADDHALVRDGMKPFLHDLAADVEILEAASFDEAIRIAATDSAPDLVLLDLKMPGMDGFNGLTKFVEQFPGSNVVIVSGHYTRNDINAALEKGARGYIPKTIGGEAMVNALRLILAGERYLPAIFMDASNAQMGRQDGHRGVPADSRLANLTKREWEILGQLVDGNSNKQIGRALGLEEITVKIHLRNVYRKMGVANRAQAVRVAMQSGWDELK